MARPSAAGYLRAAAYRSVARATHQLGAGAAAYVATPALPTILTEVRAVIAAADPVATVRAKSAAAAATMPVVRAVGSGGGLAAGDGSAGRGGMRVEPAMSARKSSQKKQRRSREKEVGRALAAADAAAAASLGNGAIGGGSGGAQGCLAGGGVVRNGMMWTSAPEAAAEREAVCAALLCLAQLVLCCKGHLPLGGRLAVEGVLNQGLRLLARAAGTKGCGEEAGGGDRGGGGWSGACSRLEDPRVAREFLGLAHACLVTPLVSVFSACILFFDFWFAVTRATPQSCVVMYALSDTLRWLRVLCTEDLHGLSSSCPDRYSRGLGYLYPPPPRLIISSELSANVACIFYFALCQFSFPVRCAAPIIVF